MRQIIILTFTLWLAAACVPQETAHIEYNNDHKKAATKNKNAQPKKLVAKGQQQITSKSILEKRRDYDNTSGILHEKKPVELRKIKQEERVLPNAVLVGEQIIYHEVQQDETIEDIAAKYKQNVAAIAAFNQLNPPYELEESQVIKIKKKQPINTRESENKLTQKNTVVDKVEFDKPLRGKIISHFGDQIGGDTSKGIHITAQKGTKISSISNGKIVYSGINPKFGNLIIVKVDKADIYAAYAHMEGLIHRKGDEVKRNEAIGYVGSTGEVDMPQLYFAMRKGSTSVDPADYIAFDK